MTTTRFSRNSVMEAIATRWHDLNKDRGFDPDVGYVQVTQRSRRYEALHDEDIMALVDYGRAQALEEVLDMLDNWGLRDASPVSANAADPFAGIVDVETNDGWDG